MKLLIFLISFNSWSIDQRRFQEEMSMLQDWSSKKSQSNQKKNDDSSVTNNQYKIENLNSLFDIKGQDQIKIRRSAPKRKKTKADTDNEIKEPKKNQIEKKKSNDDATMIW